MKTHDGERGAAGTAWRVRDARGRARRRDGARGIVAACAADLARLVIAVGAMTAAARYFGFPSADYYRFGAVFAVFLLPGWCLARVLRVVAGGSSSAERLPFALFLSYVVYGTLALACRTLSLGFVAFTAAFAVATAAAVVVWARDLLDDAVAPSAKSRVDDETLWLRMRRYARSDGALVVAATIVLSAAVFAFPYSEDQGIWDFNVLESLERRSFAPSALDVAPFGLHEAQPRMQANLFHAFFALAGWAADVSPRVLAYYAAAPFFGCCMFLALAMFVRTIAGRALGRPLALLAVLAPWSLFYRSQSSYFYEFRVLNSPTLDKDFATFFLLPLLLVLAWRFLTGGRRRDLALMIAALPATIWSHPVGPIYLFIAAGALAFAALERGRLGRCAAVAACGLAALLVCQAAIDPSSTHDDIEDLARLDSIRDQTHFWPGHYVTKDRHEHSSVVYCCGDRPVFRPRQFFGSALTHYSAVLGIVWALLYVARLAARVGPPPPSATGNAGASAPPHAASSATANAAPSTPPNTAASIAASIATAAALALVSAAVLYVERAGAFITMQHFTAGAAAAVIALIASLAPAAVTWGARAKSDPLAGGHAGTPRSVPGDSAATAPSPSARALRSFIAWPAEDVAMRVQVVYVALLMLLYVTASLVLGRQLALYRGLERLHWVYFGFFPFAFVGFYVWRALVWAVAHSVPLAVRPIALRLAAALPLAFLVVHAADQARAINAATPPALSHAGLTRSAMEAYAADPIAGLRKNTAQTIFAADGDRGADAPLAPPAWLRADDVTLYLVSSYFDYRLGAHLYPIMKQAAYYRELYSESFALERLGDLFLTSFHAYNDAVDGRITSLLLAWLRNRRVTVIVGATPELIAALQEEWPQPIERINANTYRIESPTPHS